jgi:hypothetical protein
MDLSAMDTEMDGTVVIQQKGMNKDAADAVRVRIKDAIKVLRKP